MAKSVKFEIELDSSGAIRGVKNLDDQLDRLDNTAQDASKSSADLGKSFDATGIKGIALGGIISELSTRALDMFIAGVKDSIRVGMDYQRSLAELSAITGIAGDDLAELGQTAQDQAVLTGVGINQQIEAFKLLASNIDISVIGGINGLKMLGEETVRLSQASGVDLATASNTVASAINQFGLSASEASDVVNVLAAGSKFGASEVGDLGESLKNAGTVASLAGLNLQTTVGALEVLSQNAIKGAEAGTGLRNVLLRLQSGSEELEALGITPLSVKTDGFIETMRRLEPVLDDTALMNKIFGEGAIVVASNIIKNADAVEQMTERVTGTNTALEQADINTQTLESSVNKLQEALKRLQIGAFTQNEEGLKNLTDATTQLVTVFEGPLFTVLNQIAENWTQTFQSINLVKNGLDQVISSSGELAKIWTGLKDITIGLYLALNPFADTLDDESEAMQRLAQATDEAIKKKKEYAETTKESGQTELTYQEELERQSNQLREQQEADRKRAEEQAEADRKERINQAHEQALEEADRYQKQQANYIDQFINSLDYQTEKNNESIDSDRERTKAQEELAQRLLDAKLKGTEADAKIAQTNKAQQIQQEKLAKAEKERIQAQEEGIAVQLASANASIQSVQDVGRAIANGVRQQIQAEIAGAIASQIRKVITSVPFPLNTIVLPTAIASLNFLMNKLIPQFEQGGYVEGRRHAQGGTLIEAEQGEFIINRRSMEQAPNIVQAINENPRVAERLESEFISAQNYESPTQDDRFSNGIVNGLGYNQFMAEKERFLGGTDLSFMNNQNVLNESTLQSINANTSDVNQITNNMQSIESSISDQISTLASAMSQMKVTLSLFDLQQAQGQFNQVQTEAGF